MTAGERRRALMEALYVRRHETISNFTFEFGVSRRTIKYDVLQLSLEYPIYTTKGAGGGVHVMEGCRPETSRLNETELSLLMKLSKELKGKEERFTVKTKAFGRTDKAYPNRIRSKVKGKIPEDICVGFIEDYSAEQKTIAVEIESLEKQLSETETSRHTDGFIRDIK